jgi:hypothetical protein
LLSYKGWSGPAGAVWVRRPGSGLFRRVGCGEAAEGDLEAEGSELADVVGDLAAHVPLTLVVVRAEVLIAHTGVSQQLGGL